MKKQKLQGGLIEPQEKNIIIDTQQMFSTYSNMLAAKGLIMIGGASKLLESNDPPVKILQEYFKEIVPLDFTNISAEQLENNLQKHFISSRNPLAIFIYASSLYSLKDKEVMLCLARFIESVFNGTFIEKRNSLIDNPHLEKLFKNYPLLEKKWRTPLESINLFNGKFTMIETEDPLDLFLCGSDVDGSCQNVNGIPKNTKGLLAYLMDGKIHMLAAKNPLGKIIGRVIFKIIFREEKPVLFMEKGYFESNFPQKKEVTEAFEEMAKKKADLLGISLYVDGNTKAKIPLKSFGGPAPFEYVDSAEGIRDRGEYEILRPVEIHTPKNSI